MIRRIVRVAAATLVVAASLGAAESNNEVEARKNALDLAGAFANEGFKLRDGHWSGTLKTGEHAVVAVNLYSGNEYWFSASAGEAGRKVTVQVYDETGKPVTVDNYEDEEGRAAAGLSAAGSGQFFVSVALTKGDATSVCLVYSYK